MANGTTVNRAKRSGKVIDRFRVWLVLDNRGKVLRRMQSKLDARSFLQGFEGKRPTGARIITGVAEVKGGAE